MPDLNGRVVIVTGAGSGIGRATAIRFAGEGAKVVLADIAGGRLPPVAEAIAKLGGEAISIPTDVSKRADIDRMVQAAVDRFGRVDVLVNNAGSGYGATVEQTSEEEFERLWKTNVLSVLFGMQAVLPVMRKQRSGHIISVASAAAKIAYPGIGAYSAAKHAIAALTDALRVEVADAGIYASAVFPIGTRTQFFSSARLEEGGSVGPHGPVQSPEHVAKKIVDCARRPTQEVLPYKPLRLGIAIKSVLPGVIDRIGRRSYQKQYGANEPPPARPQRESEHGEA